MDPASVLRVRCFERLADARRGGRFAGDYHRSLRPAHAAEWYPICTLVNGSREEAAGSQYRCRERGQRPVATASRPGGAEVVGAFVDLLLQFARPLRNRVLVATNYQEHRHQ